MNDFWKWRELNGPAPCVGHLDLFFYHDDQPGFSPARFRAKEAAKAICRDCAARRLCFEASIVTVDGEQRVEPGIWAGLDQVERCKRTGHPPVAGTGHKYTYMVAQKTRRNLR